MSDINPEQMQLPLLFRPRDKSTGRGAPNPQAMVEEFHERTGAAIEHVDLDVIALRVKLLEEEYIELRDELIAAQKYVALGEPIKNLAEIAKESADLMYVVFGTDVSFGIDGVKAFRRVHESNMSKLVDGKAVLRYDGKVLKGPDYQEPDMTGTYNEGSSHGGSSQKD